ncbi:MAG: PilZ domain-containing protein [Alcanivorax sp.]|nr:PilZ domain-containing protein [Alcanivorax sp.]
MERRRFTRPRLRINVRAHTNQQVFGHVRDITDEGLCLSGKGQAPTRARTLILDFPWPLEGQRQISVPVQPCWHQYDGHGHWRAGFRLQADEKTALALARLASRYGDD